MKKTVIGAALVVATWCLAQPATAGTYIPGPFPSEMSGGFVPPAELTLKGEQRASREVANLVRAVGKCFRVGAINVSRGRASKVNNCLSGNHGALVRYNRQIDRIGARHSLPPCAAGPLAAAPSTIVDLVKGFNGQVFCQSPSGAFLDGVSLY